MSVRVCGSGRERGRGSRFGHQSVRATVVPSRRAHRRRRGRRCRFLFSILAPPLSHTHTNTTTITTITLLTTITRAHTHTHIRRSRENTRRRSEEQKHRFRGDQGAPPQKTKMFSALANLLPASIKRLFEGNGGAGSDDGTGGSGGGGAGGRRQRRRSDGTGSGPVLQEATGFSGVAQGGTQGLDWYSRSMVRDEAGGEDLAHGHIDADEVERRAAAAAKAGAGPAAAGPAAGR